MSIPKDIIYDNECLQESLILAGYVGSIGFNLATPESDKDVMGVCVPNIDNYFGLNEFGHSGNGTKEIRQEPWDIVVYELRKFIRLLLKGNPNVISLLWLNEKHYIKRTKAGNMLIENRDIFNGRHVYHSFVGYSHGMLHRMSHGDIKNAGTKRKEAFDKFNYEPKNAAHLIRLMRMCIEYLTDGVFYVARQDNNQLLEIKRGEWTMERIITESDRLFALAQEVYTKTSLPLEPDKEAANKLCIDIIKTALKQ